MKTFYTRRGDDGTTGILGGGRVPKNHPRPEAVGAIDEANAALGVARSACQTPQSKTILLNIQRDLYLLMSEVASAPEHAEKFKFNGEEKVQWLEDQIESLSQIVQTPKEFIIPGDTPASAALDLARTIVRRAERRASSLYHSGALENRHILAYLNRLSSLCFILELLETQAGGKDTPTLAVDDTMP